MSQFSTRVRTVPIISGIVAELVFAFALGLVGCLISVAAVLFMGI
ncbi:MAG: hypothetical protein ABFC75_00380 [Rectinema sp.]